MRMPIQNLVLALLLTAAASGLWGCSKKSNPFNPDPLAGNGAAAENLPVVIGATPAGSISTDQVFELEFNQFMREDLLEQAAHVTLLDVSDDEEIEGLVLDYLPETRQLRISLDDDLPDDSAFLLIVRSTVTSLDGAPLDGDEDARAEGSPYDDYRIAYYTGAGAADWAGIRSQAPRIASTTPSEHGSGGISETQEITIDFTDPMDVSTLDPENFHLVNVATGEEVELEQNPVLVGPTASSVTLRPDGGDPLEFGTVYRLTIDPGVIKAPVDETEDENSPLLDLDLDEDGPDAEDRPFFFEFLTVADVGDDATPPWVDNVTNPSPSNEYFTVTFSEAMDVATLTHANIRLIHVNSGNSVPGAIIPSADGTEFRYTLQNAVAGNTYRLEVNRQVTDEAGWPLDSDGDGLGGEYDDSYATTFVY